MNKVILEARNIKKSYYISTGIFDTPKKLRAVNNISFKLEAGKTLAIVGESGSGKSTLARILTLIEEPNSGDIILINKQKVKWKDKAAIKSLRTRIPMIFQNPYSSLNPRKKIGQIIGEALVINTNLSKKEITEKVLAIMEKVGLRPEYYNRYPHVFSGGQRQRIAIARALILNPEIVVADEMVSALDISIQAQVINLLMDLQEEFNLSYVFISHDLSVVRYIADEVLVIYLGRMVEYGPKEKIFDNPLHPYTQALISATPSVHAKANRIKLVGELPTAMRHAHGCIFNNRCPYVQDICKRKEPDVEIVDCRKVMCHFAKDFLVNKGI